jgi:hypothetical protein
MSPDLERRLRELGDMLRDPSEEATRRAGRRAVAAARGSGRWRRIPLRWGLGVGVALLIGSGFGFALGTSSTSSGNAASSPVGLGFLPERGWSVLQTAKRATLAQEAIAIAANVPLSPDDAVDRLPYSTMLSLPANGVVILASFTARGDDWRDQHYPVRALPLRLGDAVPGSLRLRPKRALSQYRLHAGVNGHNVDVTVYFGTTRPPAALITAAQRQLDRLVVRGLPASDGVRAGAFRMRSTATPAVGAVGAQARIVDRTFRCTPAPLYGGLRDLDVKASPKGTVHGIGIRSTSTGYIALGSGQGIADLVHARARAEQRSPNRPWPPGVYADLRRCARARVSLPLSPKGLPGPPNRFFDESDCQVRGRVLVRVRGVLEAATPWRPADPPYAGARRNVVEAEIAVRSERARRPVAFVELGRAGDTRLWVSSGCT